MPRAKVKDEDRQRARKACIPCKSSKIRCDAEQPCKNCIRKECKSACQYVDAISHTKEQFSRVQKAPRKSYEQASAGSTQQSDHSHKEHTSTSGIGAPPGSRRSLHKSNINALITAPSPEATHSRMLFSAKGEKMYIGKYSPLSLLQFLRQTVRLQIGPSPFSETAAKDIMLEVDVNMSGEVQPNGNDTQYKQTLIKTFFEVSNGVIDLYTEDEIYNFLTQNDQTIHGYGLSTDDRTALYLTMSIGGQCRGHDLSDLQFAANCFTRARALAFEGMLCDPSINMVRIFLLMAFYTLGACRRNAAYMYIGVAAKAACALGLHCHSPHPNLSAHERDLRKRIWKSLYVLDTLVNSLLGRPGTLPLVEPELSDQGNHVSDHGTRSRPLDSAYGACTYIATIMSTVSRTAELDASFTETFLKKLGRWREHALPAQRRYTFGSASLPAVETSEQEIGKLHVACIYYYAVIVVTRPFLLSHLTYILRVRKMTGTVVTTLNVTSDAQIAKLAQVCTDTASYMTQLCEKVLNSGGLKDNMCILKALVFAAGLLLGYSNFVDGKASDSEDAFRSARVVLQKFAKLSPQARHYHEILMDFHNAIQKYQQIQLDLRRKSTNQYVQPVFVESGQLRQEYTASPASNVNVNVNAKMGDGGGGGDTGGGAGRTLSAPESNSYIAGMDYMDMNSDNPTFLKGGGGGGGVALDGTSNSTMDMSLFWDDNFDWSLFSAFPDEVNVGM